MQRRADAGGERARAVCICSPGRAPRIRTIRRRPDTHDPSPLPIPPRVYTEPISETNAVHNLEHGAVIMYYRQSGDAALPQDVVDRLATIANDGHNTILAPYGPLPDGTALALAAWNKLQTCPATDHGVAGRDHRERIHRRVPVHEQRPRGQPRRGLLARSTSGRLAVPAARARDRPVFERRRG